jgi:Primase C terminal 2 (PriCT-2)/Bifunctional DNA primase/polymerase, N-terminal/Family of unknown function (DUF5906)
MRVNIDMTAMRSLARMVDRNKQVLEAAKIYARAGAKLIPVPHNSKIPIIGGSRVDAASDNIEQIEKWFGPDGEYEGANVAMLVDGFTVVDIDKHGDKDGFETLGEALHAVSCPAADTPTGGRHLLVSDKDLKPREGVDILAPGKIFTVFPSIVNGGMYQWSSGGQPSKLPAPMVRKLGGKPAKEKLEPVTRLAPAPYVAELLDYIDPDCDYDDWLKCGMAIHHNDPGENGLAVWDTWSRGGSKYKERECERKWPTFYTDRGSAVTLKWLIYKASDNGRVTTQADLMFNSDIELDIVVNEMNKKYALFNAGGKAEVVYMTPSGIGGAMKMHSSDPYNLKIMMGSAPKLPVGKKMLNPAEVWLEHKDRRDVNRIGMWYAGTEPPDSFNMWTGLAVDSVPGTEEDIKFYLDFVLNETCSGNRVYYEYLLDILAKKIQDPLHLMRIAIVLTGGEGAGKGAFVSVIENIIGLSYSASISDRNALVGDYNGGTISGKIFVACHEAIWSGNREEGERLKALISEPIITWNAKFRGQWSEPNRMLLVITTNNSWAVPAGVDARRYFVLQVSNSRAKDAAYWREFFGLMGLNQMTGLPNNPEYLGKIRYFFEKREIKSDLSRAMETECLAAQKTSTLMGTPQEALYLWIKETFCSDRGQDHIIGAGEQMLSILTRGDEKYINTSNVDKDYREFVNRNFGRVKGASNSALLKEALDKVGLVRKLVRKNSLMAGSGPAYPSLTYDAKVPLIVLLSPEEVNKALSVAFPQLHHLEEDNDD